MNEAPKEDRDSGDAGSDDSALDSESGASAVGAQEFSPVEFNMLVLSLNASALIHLGQTAGPEAEQAGAPKGVLDLPMARNAIDMLCMLEQKTRGNLTGEEEHLLDQVLFDLRLRYARAASDPRT